MLSTRPAPTIHHYAAQIYFVSRYTTCRRKYGSYLRSSRRPCVLRRLFSVMYMWPLSVLRILTTMRWPFFAIAVSFSSTPDPKSDGREGYWRALNQCSPRREEPPMRFELMTSPLPRERSTPELRRQSTARLAETSGSSYVWAGLDSNQCRLSPANLQSAPFSHSGTDPRHLAVKP